MIKAKEIKSLIRYKEKDNNEIRFSDYDIKNAINEAIRYLNQNNALKNSDFLEKTVRFDISEINKAIDVDNEKLEEDVPLKPHLSFCDDGVELPEDYLVLVGIVRTEDGHELTPVPSIKKPRHYQYKITGSRLYCYDGSVEMVYRRVLMPIEGFSDEDIIDVPRFLLDSIVKLSSLVLNQAETDTLLDVTQTLVTSLIPKRRYQNLNKRMPFNC